MSKSIATTPQRFRFGSVEEPLTTTTAAVQAESSSIAMKLLVVFILLMYSSLGVLVPATEAVRPAMLVALGAVLFTLIEKSQTRSGFRVAWPEGAMLITLLAVCMVSTFGAIYLRLAAETTLNLAKVVLIYVVIENVVTTKGRLRTIMLTMIIGGLIPAFGTIRNFLTGHLVEGRAGFVGNFANPNEDAYGMIILVPLALVIGIRSGWFTRIFLAGACCVYLLGTYVTFSRGGLLGLVAVLGLFGWKQKSFVVKAIMIAMLAGGLLVVSMYWSRKDDFSNISGDTTVNQRIGTIKAGFQMFSDKPLFGVGPGCSVVAYPLYVPKQAHCGCQDQLVVHNAYVQMLGETGLLGFIPFMILIGASIFHAWRVQRTEDPDLRMYAMGLELAIWGFVVCGLSGGFSWSWFLYILAGLVSASRQMTSAQ